MSKYRNLDAAQRRAKLYDMASAAFVVIIAILSAVQFKLGQEK